MQRNMRKVQWVDDRGYKHLALVRPEDPDHLAPKIGIPLDPPDVDMLDWEAIKRDLHNTLIERNLLTWEDAMASQTGIPSAVLAVLRGRVVRLYREADKEK